jgi:hypothetical protein
MLGIIFTSIADMVEAQYGLATWNRTLTRAEVPDLGAYTAGANYSDDQLVRIIEALCVELKVERKDLLRLFGEYLFAVLVKQYPDITKGYTCASQLLLHVDDEIHKELAFYHPQGIQLPYFYCEKLPDSRVRMVYRSGRHLCHLAEGLIKGVGRYLSLIHI